MKAKKTAALVFAIALMFTAVACGSSKKADDVSAADANKGEKQSDGSGTTTTTRAKSTSSDTSDTSGGSSSDALGGLASSDCLAAFTAYTGLYTEALGFASGADQSQISDFEQKTQDLQSKIPSDLKDDFTTVANAYHQYAEAVKGIDYSDLLNPATQDKLTQASNALDSQDVKDAQQRIDDYFTTTCG